jgi:ATP-dependent DNA helicase RecQ
MTELSTTQATIQDAQALLSTTYGYDHFRGPQQAVIESALAGQDSVVLMPTGGGKSLCYQIPALLREGMGIIVSPLIALMQDQVSALQQLGIRANYLNSTQSTGEQQQIIEEIRFGTLDLLYVAPERLLQARTLQLLSQCKISVIAIDEAHCVSQWGHDFRQDYMGLYQLREQFPNVPRMALTATADPRTQVEITHNLQLNNAERFISGFDRPNIRYTVQPKTDAKKQLIKFLLVHREHAGIVYCMSRKKVESTAQWLCGRGLTALPYHAGLSTQIRATNLQRFLREDHIIMVATIAFGMGIDKPDVRFVAHLDLPKSLEAYYQETGRAGRDGEPSDAWMTYGLQDVVRLRQMMNQSTASEQQKRIEQGKLDALLGWSETTECRRRPLLNYFGENSTDDCGNCDNCLTPPELWDATEAAQKILSCIYRTGQRFGAVHVIDVLRGRENDKTAQWGHRELSTFGIGKEITEQQWRSILRQLIVQGYLISDAERYGALRLTETSRPLLRGEVNLLLRKDIAEAGSEKALRKKVQNKSKYGVTDGDRTLWDKLRVCRKQLADEHAVPPYVIFHDATLMEMMEYRPTTDAELLNISGVGDTKLERYGAAFLEVLNSASE